MCCSGVFKKRNCQHTAKSEADTSLELHLKDDLQKLKSAKSPPRREFLLQWFISDKTQLSVFHMEQKLNPTELLSSPELCAARAGSQVTLWALSTGEPCWAQDSSPGAPLRPIDSSCSFLGSADPAEEHRECSTSQFPTSISENQLQGSGETSSQPLSQDKRETSEEQLLVYWLQYLYGKKTVNCL